MKPQTNIITINQIGRTELKLTKSGSYIVNLTHPGAELRLLGLFQTEDDQQVAVELVIHHLAPSTQSEVILKGVASDRSKLKLSGLIRIDADCPQTVSHLTQRILLVGDQAQVESKPNLEILTDDVICSHAASISTLDTDQLFYLMSRGLSRSQAQKVLVAGFLHSASQRAGHSRAGFIILAQAGIQVQKEHGTH
ncbi:MAG: SufD family Fe-S cluster assembly protein [Patescibacteria group bacterium]